MFLVKVISGFPSGESQAARQPGEPGAARLGLWAGVWGQGSAPSPCPLFCAPASPGLHPVTPVPERETVAHVGVMVRCPRLPSGRSGPLLACDFLVPSGQSERLRQTSEGAIQRGDPEGITDHGCARPWPLPGSPQEEAGGRTAGQQGCSHPGSDASLRSPPPWHNRAGAPGWAGPSRSPAPASSLGHGGHIIDFCKRGL